MKFPFVTACVLVPGHLLGANEVITAPH